MDRRRPIANPMPARRTAPAVRAAAPGGSARGTYAVAPGPGPSATAADLARTRGDWERAEADLLAERFPDIAAKYRDRAGRKRAQVGQ